MVAETNFAETRQVIDDLAGVFMEKSDQEKVLAIQEMHNEAYQICVNREESYQKIIRGLTERGDNAEAECERQEPLEAHEERMDELRRVLSESKENAGRMTSEVESLQAEMDALVEEGKGIGARRRELERVALTEVPRVQNEMSFYANVSKVAWNYEARGVKGVVSDPGNKNLQHFELDAGKPAFEVAQALWGIIG